VQKSAMQSMLKSAVKETGPISTIMLNTIKMNPDRQPSQEEVDVLQKALEDAGYKVAFEKGKNGAWARVFLDTPDPHPVTGTDEVGSQLVMKAQGYSSAGEADALLCAMLGAVREEEATDAVGKALAEFKIKVDDTLRQKLESRYILEGGQARLDADVAQMAPTTTK
jgi:hypothetical protein